MVCDSGTSTDLVPTLLGMYDSLIGRTPPPTSDGGGAGAAVGAAKAKAKRMSCLEAPRPLSVSSMSSSSSSSSSGASSCSGRRVPKCSAYLASIESLDDSDEERPKASGSQGSGDSGVCSPPRIGHITSPCSPAGKPRYCDPNLSYMDRVVMEILDTEAVYVRDLQQVIQGYLDKWRSSSTCPLTEKQLTDLFGNIEEIYRFNKGFLEDLEHCGLDPVQIARCFVCHNEGFSIYTHYCTNYPRTVSVLTELMRQENTVRLFRERQTALQHTLPLGSYLLKPVQRILKYHLLLQNIVKNYVCEAEGYSDIVDALATMTGIAHHINNMKRRHEHAVRVQEIQSLLYGWEGEDLTTFGELCAEGAFRIYGAKAMRHAFLFDRMLLITKKKEEGILSYKTHIMCSNLMLIESVPGEPFSFHVIPFDNPRLQYTLQARNLEQKREWTMQLKRVILENYNAVIPSHARQLVMELGQNRTDDEIMADKTAPKRQHSAPEYLEKRKQEKERRKSETGLRARLRRSRKSDVGLSSEEVSQPRRGRRASSSSRERSQSREGLRSVSPAKIKERFGSWRRKSEPGCYSSGRKSEEPAKLTLPPDNDISVDEPVQPCNTDPLGVNTEKPEGDKRGEDTEVQDMSIIDSSQESVVMEVEINGSDKLDVEAKTLEEIVGQLLMQNHEFQKILKKQQRHVSLRSRFLNSNGTKNSMVNKDETTDDEDGVYETLVVSSTPAITKHASGQSYRAHRYAHMRALRNEQKTVTVSGGSVNKSKRQSLISRSENDKSDSGFDADYVTLMYKRETSCALRETSEPEIIETAKPTNKGIGAKQSWVREKCNALGKNIANFPRSRLEKKGSDHSHVQEESKDKNSNNGNYENLQQIWERVKRQQEEIRKLAESEEISREVIPNNLRRTQSFTCHEVLGDMNDIDKPCLVPAASEISIDTLNIPTLPAVWLKLQGEHLATPNKKSGSLPRSFQLAHDNHTYPASPSESECPNPKTGYRARLLTRDGRASSDRPFTIASDKAADINFEDIERYIDQSEACNVRHQFPLNGDTTEEDSMTEYTTPNASLDELNVHPEYKIYRPSISKASLKHVISSMGSKLSGLKASSETLEVSELESEREQILQRERRASRLVYALARQYSKTLKQRIKTIMGEESEDCCETNLRSPSPLPNGSNTQLPIYKQGSSSLGARIAHCSEYANPRQLFPNIHLKPGSEVRPDSVLSVSSNFTSSSDGDKTSGFSGSIDTNITSPLINSDVVSTTPVTTSVLVEKVEELHLSDGSGDSYYERSFEAIESFLENEVFRDSAVFSDHDDIVDSSLTVTKSSKPAEKYKKLPLSHKPTKVPPPVPAKPCRLRSNPPDKPSRQEETVLYQKEEQSLVKGLEGISKSIQERRRELELWKAGMSSKEDECDTSSQHSTASTVIEVSPIRTEVPETEDGPTPRGWVKHIVGMLQGDETQ